MKKFLIAGLAAIIAGCGGGGSNTSAPTATISSTSNTTTNSCTNPHTSTYPTEYNGIWPTPSVTQQLDKQILRSVGFKDYSPPVNSRLYSTSCPGEQYAKLMYTITLDRLKELGVDTVWMYNYGSWTVTDKNSVWTMDPNNMQISFSLMQFILQEAQKRNIKVYLAWQFHNLDTNNNQVIPNDIATPELMRKAMIAHRKNIVELAKFGEQYGLAGIAADYNAWNVVNFYDDTIAEIFISETSTTIDELRKVFSGKITLGQMHLPWNDARTFDKIDAIHISAWIRISENERLNFSSDVVRDAFSKQIYEAYMAVNCYGAHAGTQKCLKQKSTKEVPVIFEFSPQSRDKYWTEGWVEDGFCVNGKLPNGTSHNCIQQTYKTDFSVQAVGTHGLFQAATQQKYFKVFAINFHSSYWHTDTLVPSGYDSQSYMGEGFPNLSQSIRGKPAETVVKQWFKRT